MNNLSKQSIARTILRKPVTYLLLISTIGILLVNTGSLNSIDTLSRLQVTHSLWMNVPQVREDDNGWQGYAAIGRDGKKYVTWGLGQSLVMLPADIISHKLTDGTKLSENVLEKIRVGIVAYLTFIPINILSIIISFNLLKTSGFDNKKSIYGTLGLLFCTTFLPYAQTHQENSLLFLTTSIGYLLNLKWIISNSSLLLFLGACALGFNILIRVPAAIDIFSVFIFTIAVLIMQAKIKNCNLYCLKKRIWRYLLVCVPTYLVFLGLDRLYHWMRFNSLTGTYTSIWAEQMKQINPTLPTSFPFNIPFEVGFFGFLFSPDRSVFLFNPLLVIVLVLSLKYWQKISYVVKALLLSLIFMLFADILVYAKWFLWGGAGAWGPRYVTTPMQLLSLLSIPLLIQLHPFIKKGLERIFYKIIVLLSCLVQVSSVILDFNLELTQEAASQQPLLVIAQRLINLVAIWTGNFRKWGLMPDNISSAAAQHFITPRFMPWTISSEIPKLSYLLQLVWFIGIVVLIILVATFMETTSYKVIDYESEKRSEFVPKLRRVLISISRIFITKRDKLLK